MVSQKETINFSKASIFFQANMLVSGNFRSGPQSLIVRTEFCNTAMFFSLPDVFLHFFLEGWQQTWHVSIIEYVNTFEASSFLGRKYLQKSADDGTWRLLEFNLVVLASHPRCSRRARHGWWSYPETQGLFLVKGWGSAFFEGFWE